MYGTEVSPVYSQVENMRRASGFAAGVENMRLPVPSVELDLKRPLFFDKSDLWILMGFSFAPILIVTTSPEIAALGVDCQ